MLIAVVSMKKLVLTILVVLMGLFVVSRCNY